MTQHEILSAQNGLLPPLSCLWRIACVEIMTQGDDIERWMGGMYDVPVENEPDVHTHAPRGQAAMRSPLEQMPSTPPGHHGYSYSHASLNNELQSNPTGTPSLHLRLTKGIIKAFKEVRKSKSRQSRNTPHAF